MNIFSLATLESYEEEWCVIMGTKEYNRKGDKGQHHEVFKGRQLLENRIKAKRAEFVAAKTFGYLKPNSIDTWSGPDFGSRIQVKWTPHPSGNLLVSAKMLQTSRIDPRKYTYFLIGGDGVTFVPIGWTSGEKVFEQPPQDFGFGLSYRVLKRDLSRNWDELGRIARSP